MLLLRRLARSVENNGVGGAIAHSWQRLIRSLKNHGISGTWERAFRKAPKSPAVQVPEPPHPFDVFYGTDTGGYISGADLVSTSQSSLYNTAYYGIAPSSLTHALRSLPLELDRFTFIDLGCGKGRAVMVASELPFPRLIGVEIAPELCEAARANIALKPEWASRITILNHDATTVEYPETPLLVFLFHPFLAPVLRRVLANLERQLRRSPREMYLLYARNPRYTKVLERFPFLEEISDTAHPLSPWDAAVDRFGLTEERFTLYRANLPR